MHRFYTGKKNICLVGQWEKEIFPRGNLPTPSPSKAKWFAPKIDLKKQAVCQDVSKLFLRHFR